MALPQAVQAHVDEAEQLQRSLYESAAPGQESQPGSEETVAPAQSNVIELPQAAAPAPETPVAPAGNQDAEYWKQRFETLQGKYNAEVPRMQAQLRAAGEDVADLREQVQQLRTAPPTPAETPVVEGPATQKDIDDFGQDLIDVMTRVARAEAQRIVQEERAALEQKFGAVENRVGEVVKTVAVNATEKFWKDVIDLLPEWPVIDQDPAWIAWLDTSPDFSETTYRESAASAISKREPKKIVKLVEEWRKTKPAEAAAQPADTPASPVPTPSTELASQVTPSGAKGGAVPVVEKRIYTRAEYEQMYDVRNVQKFGMEEANRLIAEADTAVAEGRVRWT